MKFVAKTLMGLEEVLAAELIGLGADQVEINKRAVSFEGDKALLYKANLHLRTALRILMPVYTFRAKTPEEIYDGLSKFNWEKYLNLDQTFAIESTVFSDYFPHSKFVTYKVKDALVDSFRNKYGKRPDVDPENPNVSFNFHVSQHICTLSLDSSGESLHKRGYRSGQNEAPISEVLAAGMLLLAGWNGQSDLLDPMCGSGTILIEAALIALNIPPGIYRSGFAFEKWNDFDKELFDMLYQDDSGEREFKYKIYGSDISGRSLGIARENIKGAGMAKYIELNKISALDVDSPGENCMVVTNPPYGERINTEDIQGLYAGFGTVLKHKFAGCSAWIISSDKSLLDKIGFKPSRKIKLLNGSLECLYNKYEVFEGKAAAFKNKDKIS